LQPGKAKIPFLECTSKKSPCEKGWVFRRKRKEGGGAVFGGKGIIPQGEKGQGFDVNRGWGENAEHRDYLKRKKGGGKRDRELVHDAGKVVPTRGRENTSF